MERDENMDLKEEINNIREMLRQREPKVQDHIETALSLADARHDMERKGDLLVSYSNFYSLIKRDLDKCIEYADKAKPYFDMSSPRRASYYFGNLGINYHFFFKLPEAQAAYLTAIQHMEKIDDHSPSESNMLATIYYNLYILFSFTDLAILDRSYLDRAMELYQKNNHVPGIIFCYGAIINDLDKQGKIEEALEFSKKRLKLAEDTDNTLQTGLSASTTGLLYAKLQDRKSSEAYFSRAHDILFGKDIVPFHASYYDEKAQAHLAWVNMMTQ
jgi:tetratricopeptide (TPR) repeat protein